MKDEGRPERRRGLRGFLSYRLPAVLWSSLLLLMSTGTLSSDATRTGLAGLLFWLIGYEASMMTIDVTNFFIRKLAHLVSYALAATLWLRAVRYGRTGLAARWIARALALTLLVAALDEFNQARTWGRTGSGSDVILDMLGATIAMLILAKWRARA